MLKDTIGSVGDMVTLRHLGLLLCLEWTMIASPLCCEIRKEEREFLSRETVEDYLMPPLHPRRKTHVGKYLLVVDLWLRPYPSADAVGLDYS